MTSAHAASPPASVPYLQLGGEPAVRQWVNRFYDQMERDPTLAALRAVHAPDLTPMRQILFEFMSGWLGGPRTYWERGERRCMMSAHAGLAIDASLAAQWLTCMQQALDELPVEPAVRELVSDALRRTCRGLINRR